MYLPSVILTVLTNRVLVGIPLFQEWLRAFPDYSLDPSKKVTWANGQVRGPRILPVLTKG